MTETPDIISRLRQDANHREKVQRNPLLATLLREAADHIEQQAANRRAFLDRAVCHPGPPLYEHEGYTGEEDLGEHEANILERMGRELRLESDLGTIWRLTEEAMGGTLGLGRNISTDPLDAVRRLLNELAGMVNDAVAKRYPNGGHHEETLPLVERVRREIERGLATLPSREPASPELPVRTPVPSAKQGLFRKYKVCRWDGMCDPADSEYFVLRLPAAPGSPEQRALAAYADTVESTHPQLASDMRGRYQLRGPVDVDNGQRDAVAEHIRAAGGDPEAATVAQIADALNATSEGATFTVNEAGDGVNWEIDQKARVTSIEVVGGDAVVELGLAPARPVPPMTGGLADRIIDSAYEVVPPYTNKCTSMGTSYEEASEWAGAPPVDVDKLAAEALADEFPCNFVTTRQVVALVGAARAREVLTEAYATNVHPVTVANRVAAKRAP